MGTNKEHTYHIEISKSSESKFEKIRNATIVIVLSVCLIALYFLSRYNYLLFHSIVEIFSIVIAFAIFAIAWNSRTLSDNSYFLFIGIAFLFIGALDTIHTLAYNGMGVFPNVGTNLATQIWIASRYVESFSLLIALFFIQRRFRSSLIFVGYSAITGLLLVSVYLGIFPAAFINGVGLTPFKIASEYVISFVLLGAIGLLWRNRSKFSGNVSKLLITAMAVTIASEMSFTLYTDAYGLVNVIGHLLKVVAFYLIYKALVETGLSKPYDLLFYNLKQKETTLKTQAVELEEVNSRLVREALERKKAEEALKQSERLYHTVFDNSQDGFQLIELVHDKNGKACDHKILEVNQSYEKIIGVKAVDVTGKTAKSISPNCESYWFEIPDRVAKTGQTEHVELYNRDIDKYLDCYYFRYADNVVGTLFRDITERKNLETQLKDAERLSTIGATAGMVGHDIRNPLQAITSDVYLVKTDLASISESEEKKNALESLDEIEKNVSYINKIVADLQDFSRPISPKLEETDLEKIIHSVLVTLNTPENIRVVHSIRKDFPKFKTDQTYIQRIITNLSNNAVQAMPNGGKLAIEAFNKDGKATITIQDTGEGIPENVKNKIFTPLVTTKAKGQGFGLSVVKRFTEALGGTITFESEVGKGTKFTIELPLTNDSL